MGKGRRTGSDEPAAVVGGGGGVGTWTVFGVVGAHPKNTAVKVARANRRFTLSPHSSIPQLPKAGPAYATDANLVN
jgi:hypothetical protein